MAAWVSLSPEDALQNYTGGNLTVTGPRETASIFATYPASYLSLNNGFLDQVGVSEETFVLSPETSAYCFSCGWDMRWDMSWHVPPSPKSVGQSQMTWIPPASANTRFWVPAS